MTTNRTALFSRKQPGGVFTIESVPEHPGAIFFVDSATGTDGAGYGKNPDAPLASIDYAIGLCTANKGDVIYVMPGHAETINTAGGITCDKAGISIVGLGNGEDRPTVTIGSSLDTATVLISAVDVLLKNLILVPGNDGVDVLIDINADGAIVEDCELRSDETNTYQADTYIDINGGGANAADRVTIRRCKISSVTAGANQAIEIGAVEDGLRIEDNWIVGDYAVAGIHSASILTNALIARNLIHNVNAGDFCIEFADAATGLLVDNRLYANAAATTLDPGSMMCVNNHMVNAIDNSSIPVPTTAGGIMPVGAIGATSFAAGAIDAAAIADNAIDAGAIAANAIAAAKIADGAITAAKIATDAIDADALAADAVAEIADGITDEATSGHVTAATVGAMLQTPHSGAAQAGANGSVTLAATASATSDLYNGCVVQIISGTGVGQVRLITDYDGGTKIASVAPNWTTNPAAASVSVIQPVGVVRVDAMTDGVITATTIATGAIDADAIAADAIDASALAADAVAEIADGVFDEVASGHVTAATVGAILQTPHSGAAQAGAAGTVTLAAAASATNDLYNGCTIHIISGTGVGQARLITDYDGGTKIASVVPNWATNPAAASVYVILPVGPARVDAITDGIITAGSIAADAIGASELAADAVAEIADGVADEVATGHVTAATLGAMLQPLHSATAQAGAAGTITLAATASATNNLYNGAVVQVIGGTGVGQIRLVTAYDGGTKVATVAPNWTTNPANDSVYVIHPVGSVRLDAITAGIITAAAIATDAVDADALAADAVAEIADGVLDEVIAGHQTAATAGAMLQTPHSGAAQAGAAATVTLAAAASATNNLYNGCTIQIISGTGAGQARLITAYDGGTKVATVAPAWTTQPVAADVYVIHPQGQVKVDAISDGMITAAAIATGAIDADAVADGAIDAGALAADAITNAKIADGALASEQFAASAGEKTTDGIVVTRATAAIPQSASAAISTVTRLCLLKRIVGYVSTVLGAATPNASKLKVDTTGPGATTDLCIDLDLDAEAAGTILQITGTFANPMVATLDLPIAQQQAVDIVVPPGSIMLECDGSDGGTGRIRWSATYVPLESGANIVAA